MKELNRLINDQRAQSTFSWGINDFPALSVKGNEEHLGPRGGERTGGKNEKVSEYRREGFLILFLS